MNFRKKSLCSRCLTLLFQVLSFSPDSSTGWGGDTTGCLGDVSSVPGGPADTTCQSHPPSSLRTQMTYLSCSPTCVVVVKTHREKGAEVLCDFYCADPALGGPGRGHATLSPPVLCEQGHRPINAFLFAHPRFPFFPETRRQRCQD